MPQTVPINHLPEVKITWPIDNETTVVMLRPDGVTIRTTVGHVLETYLLKLYNDQPPRE
jgi:hypothetical protein